VKQTFCETGCEKCIDTLAHLVCLGHTKFKQRERGAETPQAQNTVWSSCITRICTLIMQHEMPRIHREQITFEITSCNLNVWSPLARNGIIGCG